MTTKYYGTVGTTAINRIGIAGSAGFGVGICPSQLLPNGIIPLFGYDDPSSDNYGNYQYKDGSIMCWIPKFYYLISTNTVTIKGIETYANEQDANADNYALHRAFIDGGIEQQGFFIDKYMCSKNGWGSGYIASSIKEGLPISTHTDHNPIADLTACGTNAYFECIDAAHARDGVNGAVNASSIFHCSSRIQQAVLAILSLAHGQASSATTYCAWYGVTYNYPKGCNNNALGDVDDAEVSYVTDGYSICGKTGSGTPFAKTTHNGQACGVADVNGLMYEVNIGITCIASGILSIEAMAQTDPCEITWTGHGMSTGDPVMILGITQADWVGAKDKVWTITKINDSTCTIAFDASGFGTPYDAGTDPGTITKGTFYLAKEATAMKDFTSGTAGATDHWGVNGVAAMMDEFNPAFKDGGVFIQRFGSGANQVLAEDINGNPWFLTGLGFPKDGDGMDTTGTNLFGKDYFYQYVRNELCLLSGGIWGHDSRAGVWLVYWYDHRTTSSHYVGWRAACYPE